MVKVTQMNTDENGGRRRIHLREISGDSETPLETVGQDLRAARLRRGDDLATVSRYLKIRKDHLEAVEQDNFAGLPGKAYAIGFVRSYAGYLGLDATQTVERYKQEIAGRHDTMVIEPSYNSDEARFLPYGWRIVAGVIGLALIYGVWHLVSGGPSPQPVPPAPALSPPHAQVTAIAPAPAPVVPPAATGDTAVPPPATGNAAPVPAPNSGGSVAAAATQDTAKPNPAASSISQTPPAGPGQVYGGKNANARVILQARTATHLTVRGQDGTVFINRDMGPGDSYHVPNIPGLTLATSDASALDVTLDGKALGKVGQNPENLDQVPLSPASLVDRFKSH